MLSACAGRPLLGPTGLKRYTARVVAVCDLAERAASKRPFLVVRRPHLGALSLLLVALACGGSSPSEPGAPPVKPTPPSLALSSVPRFTNLLTFPLSGTTQPYASVSVSGGTGQATASANSSGAFTATVPLLENQGNSLTVVATGPTGLASQPLQVSLTHDNLTPSVRIHEPIDSHFDSDGDSRVNISFSFSDSISGVKAMVVVNDRDIGAGVPGAGKAAGANILSATAGTLVMGEDSVAFNTGLDHEFPIGTNTLIVSVTDSAGNVAADTTAFEVFGTAPSFSITQPTDGQIMASSDFSVAIDFSDIGGTIHPSGLILSADKPLVGVLKQDGSSSSTIAADETLTSLFEVSDSSATFVNEGDRLFPGGEVVLTGYAEDAGGNLSAISTVAVTFPAPAHALMVVNTTAGAGVTGHPIPIGLSNFTDLGGAQFTLNYDPTVVTVDSITSVGRAPQNPFYEISEDGTAEILLVDLGGDPIPTGSGVVVNLHASIDSGSPAQIVALTITDVEIANSTGIPLDVSVRDGSLSIQR